MKFTCSALIFLSCLHVGSSFVQQTFVQRATTISPIAYVERTVKQVQSSSVFASSDDDMLGLFGDDDEDEERVDKETLSIYRDADIIFALIDIDGNRNVSREEISNHLTVAGYAEKQINQIFDKIDVNKDGAISKDEFRNGMVLIKALQTAPGLGNYNAEFVKEIYEDADQVFQSADADGNGEIEELELKSHLRRTLPKYSDEAVNNIFRTLDKDGDKLISRKELREAFLRCSALRQAIGEGPNFK